MILLISLAISIVILAIIIFSVPLKMTAKGKTMVFIFSVLIGVLGVFSLNVLPLWQTLLFPVVLSILFSYLLIKRPSLYLAHVSTVEKVKDPMFSYEKQVQLAKQAETVDNYYVSVPRQSDVEVTEEEMNATPSKTDELVVETVEVEEIPSMDTTIVDFVEMDETDFTNRLIETELPENKEIASTVESEEELLMLSRRQLFESETVVDSLPEDHGSVEVILSERFEDLEEKIDAQESPTEKPEDEPQNHLQEKVLEQFEDLEALYLSKKKGGDVSD